MLPLSVDDELELVRAGRDRSDDRPCTRALVEHLNGLPVVPVARQLYIVLRTVREDKLRLHAVGGLRFSAERDERGESGGTEEVRKRSRNGLHVVERSGSESTYDLLLVPRNMSGAVWVWGVW